MARGNVGRVSLLYCVLVFLMVCVMVWMLVSSCRILQEDYQRELSFVPHSYYKTGVLFGEGNGYFIPSTPNHPQAYVEAVKTLGESNEYMVSIPYYGDGATWKEIESGFFEGFYYCYASYPEFFSNKSSFTIQRLGIGKEEYLISISLNNEAVESVSVLLETERMFRSGILRHLAVMREAGLLGGDAVTEITNVLVYIAEQVEYKIEEDDPYMYSGYTATERGTAVCQGYVAMFHGMLQALGYETLGITGTVKVNDEAHIWSKVKVDGEVYYFDPTFLDGSSGVNMNWAFMTRDEISLDRVVDDFPIHFQLKDSW